MTLQQAVSESRKAADNVESQDWLTTFDAKMTALGYGNIGAKCECSDPDMGHEPECGWGPVATEEPKKSASGFSAPMESTNGIKVSLNESKGGIELRFPGKPAASVLASLKSAGWRWSRFSSCWWSKQSPSALAFAYGLAVQAVPTEDAGLKAMTDVDSQQEDAWGRQVGR